MSTQSDNQRVLSRTGARILKPEELTHVSGARNQTFAFTHIINPDTTTD